MAFGLIAALCYGAADFLATISSRRSGVIPTLLAVQVVGLLIMAALIALRTAAPTGSPEVWIAMVGISGVNFAGTLLLYRAFAIGTLSIVSPIASGFAVVTAALALTTGERPPGGTLLGAGLLILGVAIVSRAPSATTDSRAGLPEAVGAALCLGSYYWALGQVTPEMGVLWPVLVTRAVQLVLCLAVTRTFVPLRRASVNVSYILIGILDTGALLAFNLGVDSDYTTITTAITSLYSVVTIFLAWIVLRDRLSTSQWGGIAVVITGALLVSL